MPVRCKIVEVPHLEDRVGTLCGKPAAQWCNDCGSALCEAHRDPCEFCQQVFCSVCLSFHLSERHAKPPASMTFETSGSYASSVWDSTKSRGGAAQLEI